DQELTERLKKKLLSGAVAENVRTIRNERPSGLKRRWRVHWPLLGALAALFVGSAALWLALQKLEPPVPEAVAPQRPADMEPASASPGLPARIASQVFPLAVHRIVVDPGHGGTDMGTHTPAGVPEKELTLDIAKRLVKLLADGGFDVSLTRDS